MNKRIFKIGIIALSILIFPVLAHALGGGGLPPPPPYPTNESDTPVCAKGLYGDQKLIKEDGDNESGWWKIPHYTYETNRDPESCKPLNDKTLHRYADNICRTIDKEDDSKEVGSIDIDFSCKAGFKACVKHMEWALQVDASVSTGTQCQLGYGEDSKTLYCKVQFIRDEVKFLKSSEAVIRVIADKNDDACDAAAKEDTENISKEGSDAQPDSAKNDSNAVIDFGRKLIDKINDHDNDRDFNRVIIKKLNDFRFSSDFND